MLAMNAQNNQKIKPNQEKLCVSYVDALAVGKHGHVQESFYPVPPGSLGVSIFFVFVFYVFSFLFALYLFAGVWQTPPKSFQPPKEEQLLSW